jgi:hypothetical protein
VAPAFFSSDRASFSKPITITTGFAGKMSAVTGGMKEIVRNANTITPAPAGSVDTLAQMADSCHRGINGVRSMPVTFTTSTMAAQFELFDRDTSGQGGDDLDLVMVNAAGALVAYSASYGSDEVIALAAPPAGSYRVCTIGYSTVGDASATYGLHSVVVNTSDKGGNLKALVPAQVFAGGKATIPVSWSGLQSGKRFLGAVRFLDATGAIGATTVVQVETNQPVPLGERQQRSKFKDSNI